MQTKLMVHSLTSKQAHKGRVHPRWKAKDQTMQG